MIEDECGAPEFFTGGARLHPVDGPSGKIDPDLLRKAIAKFPAEFVHHGQPMAVTITQATEAGTVYSIDEIRAISVCVPRGRHSAAHGRCTLCQCAGLAWRDSLRR